MDSAHMKYRDEIVEQARSIREQARNINAKAKEQYVRDVGGKVYKRNGISQFHALAHLARWASTIEMSCDAIIAEIELLDKLYANEPIVSPDDVAKAKELIGEKDLF